MSVYQDYCNANYDSAIGRVSTMGILSEKYAGQYCVGDLAEGCCSSVTPCSHQKMNPGSICDVCQKAAKVGGVAQLDVADRLNIAIKRIGDLEAQNATLRQPISETHPWIIDPGPKDERSILQNDLRDMLRALGLPDSARPQSPHEVFRECIEEVKRIAAPGATDLSFGNLLCEMMRLMFVRYTAPTGVPTSKDYMMCRLCGGTDAERPLGQRPSLENVQHIMECQLERHWDRLKAMADKGVT